MKADKARDITKQALAYKHEQEHLKMQTIILEAGLKLDETLEKLYVTILSRAKEGDRTAILPLGDRDSLPAKAMFNLLRKRLSTDGYQSDESLNILGQFSIRVFW